MYEVIHINFFVRDREEFASVILKVNCELRSEFSCIEQIVNRLQSHTSLPQSVFKFSFHSFLGVER